MAKHTIPRQRTSSKIPATPVVLARRAALQPPWIKVNRWPILMVIGIVFFTAFMVRMMFG